MVDTKIPCNPVNRRSARSPQSRTTPPSISQFVETNMEYSSRLSIGALASQRQRCTENTLDLVVGGFARDPG